MAFDGEEFRVICYNKNVTYTIPCTVDSWPPNITNVCGPSKCEDNYCQHGTCVDCEIQFSCNCTAGFKQNMSQGPCEDINECKEYSLCSPQMSCSNTIGSYNCSYDDSDSTLEVYPGPSWTKDKNVPEEKYLLPNKSLVRK